MDALMAYQIGFDLYESAPQNFLIQIQDSLTSLVPKSPSPPAVVAATQQKADEGEQAAADGQDEETAMETETENSGEAEAASNDEKKKEDSEGESAHQQKTESATSGATT